MLKAVRKWSKAVWEITRVFPNHQGWSGKQGAHQLTEPSSIGLHTSGLGILLAFLERCGLDNFTVSVSNGLSTVEHLENRGLFGISVEVLTLMLVLTDTIYLSEACTHP